MNQWVCTDGALQWRKKIISDKDFSLFEVRDMADRFTLCFKQDVNINDYEEETLYDIVSAYYSGSNFEECKNTILDSMIKPDEQEMWGIIAECIFECMTEDEMDCILSFDTEDLASEVGQALADVNIDIYDMERLYDNLKEYGLDPIDIACALKNRFDGHGLYHNEEDVADEWLAQLDECPDHLIPYIDLHQYGKDLVKDGDTWLHLPSGMYLYGQLMN